MAAAIDDTTVSVKVEIELFGRVKGSEEMIDLGTAHIEVPLTFESRAPSEHIEGQLAIDEEPG